MASEFDDLPHPPAGERGGAPINQCFLRKALSETQGGGWKFEELLEELKKNKKEGKKDE
jgi:hypothetical protein